MVEPWGSTLVSNLQTYKWPLQGGNLESGCSRLYIGRPYTKSGENIECPFQDFIDFAMKMFYKFLIIICYFHKILYDSDIPYIC